MNVSKFGQNRRDNMMKYEDQIKAAIKHIYLAKHEMHEAYIFSSYMSDDIKDKCMPILGSIDKLIQDIETTNEYITLKEKYEKR